MPTSTYTPLANIKLNSPQSSVTFSSISQAYKDLIIVMNVSVASTTWPSYRFNGDSGGNYNYIVGYTGGGSRGSTSSMNDTQIYFDPNGAINTSIETITINIFDYSTTNKYKATLHRKSKADGYVNMVASKWANTSAITSISFISSQNWVAGSTFTLYGVAG